MCILVIAASCSYCSGWRSLPNFLVLVIWVETRCTCGSVMTIWFSVALLCSSLYFFFSPFCVEQLSALQIYSGTLMKVVRPCPFSLDILALVSCCFSGSFLDVDEQEPIWYFNRNITVLLLLYYPCQWHLFFTLQGCQENREGASPPQRTCRRKKRGIVHLFQEPKWCGPSHLHLLS